MNTLQDVRDAQQIWEYKFNRTGRKPITLNPAKAGWKARILGFNKKSDIRSVKVVRSLYFPGKMRNALV